MDEENIKQFMKALTDPKLPFHKHRVAYIATGAAEQMKRQIDSHLKTLLKIIDKMPEKDFVDNEKYNTIPGDIRFYPNISKEKKLIKLVLELRLPTDLKEELYPYETE